MKLIATVMVFALMAGGASGTGAAKGDGASRWPAAGAGWSLVEQSRDGAEDRD